MGSTGRARRLFAAGRNKGLLLTEREKTPSTKTVLQKQRAEGWFQGICVKELFLSPLNSPKDEKAAHQNRDPVVIQGRRCVLDQLYPLGEEEEGKDSWESKRRTLLGAGGRRKAANGAGGRRCKTRSAFTGVAEGAEVSGSRNRPRAKAHSCHTPREPSSAQHLPTLPTIRSLPRKKRKSVTLSKTATLETRER